MRAAVAPAAWVGGGSSARRGRWGFGHVRSWPGGRLERDRARERGQGRAGRMVAAMGTKAHGILIGGSMETMALFPNADGRGFLCIDTSIDVESALDSVSLVLPLFLQ